MNGAASTNKRVPNARLYQLLRMGACLSNEAVDDMRLAISELLERRSRPMVDAGKAEQVTTKELSLQQYTPDWADGSFDAEGGGGWVKHGDVMGIIAYVGGYLDAHAVMLEAQGVHTAIIEAVDQLRKDLSAL